MEAGSDTSAAFLLSLVLILSVYPEYQERARHEIESIVGTTRLPELEDFKHMPFVDALIKEVIRIRPAFPIGVPHLTTEEIRVSLFLIYAFACSHEGDKQYKEYVVPKNTTVILNTCTSFLCYPMHVPSQPDSIFHNPDIFEAPEVFNPDRFIQSEYGTRTGRDTDFRDNFLFGGGRVRL